MLDTKQLTNGSSSREEIADAGAFNTLEVQIQVLSSSTTGTIILQHTAVLESDAWIDLGTSVSLTETSNQFVSFCVL